MSEERKNDHIDLTFQSKPDYKIDTNGLFYEPLFSAHPKPSDKFNLKFLGHDFSIPLWVSSMTGGAQRAEKINSNLAKACGQFGFGMGLGSCRVLLDEKSRWKDFDVKEYMPNHPLFSNFGIAQLEELIEANSLNKIKDINNALNLDGLIIHVNPLQEWAQPEGDSFKKPPLETIKIVLAELDLPIIVKEVGQGFGPQSLDALCRLPLAAIETSAFGGTNFTNIELARLNGTNSGKFGPKTDIARIGHTNQEMVSWINEMNPNEMKCKEFILSGGISSPLEGFKFTKTCNYNSVMGMASGLLKYSMGEYQVLEEYLVKLKSTLLLCNAYLR